MSLRLKYFYVFAVLATSKRLQRSLLLVREAVGTASIPYWSAASTVPCPWPAPGLRVQNLDTSEGVLGIF